MEWINNSMAKFIGFSTIGRVKAPYSITGSELVKRDLMNEFYTRRGERLMRPRFGSIIWDLLMDPSTQDLDNAIRQDITAIVKRDPRVKLKNIVLLILDHTISAEVTLEFLPIGNADTLYLNYKREITEGID
jgi:phage baseplate assembly protein W